MKRTLYLALTFAGAFSATAQHDRIISNWSQSQMIYNPGAVATGPGDMSFFANHRSQWLTVPEAGVGMRSNFINGEFKIQEDGLANRNNFGVGFSILSDQTGAANLTTLSVSLPLNYTLALDRQNKLSIGVAPGFIQQASDRSGQTWENQWDGTVFNPATSVENSINGSYATMDLGTGIYFQHQINNRSSFYAGYALNHLIKPKMAWSFSGDKMYMQMVLQGGADLATKNPDFRIQPNFVFFRTKNTNSLTAGVTFENTIKEGSKITGINKSNCVNYGVYYRHGDAVVATFGMKVSQFRFGLSFDANTSKLNQATGGIGGVELYFKALLNFKKFNAQSRMK
jgi:type IX secretion system PorP/SprF family membrane protein